MHTDYNQEEDTLIFPFFKGTLLGLIKGDPDLPGIERKKVLRGVAEAIQDLHDKDWIHISTISAILR